MRGDQEEERKNLFRDPLSPASNENFGNKFLATKHKSFVEQDQRRHNLIRPFMQEDEPLVDEFSSGNMTS